MTGQQKEHITAMRMQGIDYSTIAKSLGLKKETVAAFCRKNGLSSVKAADSRVIPSQTDTCLVCGTVLVQIPGRKKCRFCSETAVGNTVPFPAPSLKEPCPCLNPIVSAYPPCCASKGSIPFGILRTSLLPTVPNIPPEAHHNFVQYIPPQQLAICRRVW